VRGMPLPKRDTDTRNAIAALRGTIDTKAAIKVWDEALQVPEWEHRPVWFHGDMLPGNLLVEHGRLSAVIDFGGLAVGDPSCDLMIAWGLFSGESREVFRTALQVGGYNLAARTCSRLVAGGNLYPILLNTIPWESPVQCICWMKSWPSIRRAINKCRPLKPECFARKVK